MEWEDPELVKLQKAGWYQLTGEQLERLRLVYYPKLVVHLFLLPRDRKANLIVRDRPGDIYPNPLKAYKAE